MERKICSKCKKEKDLIDFYKDKRMLLGVTSQCKECHCAGQMKYYENNYEKVRNYQLDYSKKNNDKIKEYNQRYFKEKIEEDPNYFKDKYKQYQSIQLEYHKKYRNDPDNNIQIREYLLNYYSKIENKKKINAYWRNRYKNDIKFKVKQNIGNRVRATLISGKKNNNLETILGYSINCLIHHLESQFQEGMTWDNYGQWHIDHIKPIDSFYFQDYNNEEFKNCWSLENLQPLWAEENLQKSNKII